MAFDSNQYKNDFGRQNYDRMTIIIPKGKSKVIKALANKQGKSISGVVVEALEAHFKLDLSKGSGE